MLTTRVGVGGISASGYSPFIWVCRHHQQQTGGGGTGTGTGTGYFNFRHHHHHHQVTITRLVSPSSSLLTTTPPPTDQNQPPTTTIHVSNSDDDLRSNSNNLQGFTTPANNNRMVEQGLLEQSKYLAMSDGGPPRWFSPLDSRSRSRSPLPNSPLLLYLPGIDGTGLGLYLHHPRLGEMFHVWCLHIPATDRTTFAELVKLVESTVKSENYHSPERPIYLVAESFGACLALAVASRNPGIDLVLVLANPATCFNKSQLRPLIPLLEAMPKQLGVGFSYLLNLMTGVASTMAAESGEKRFPLQQTDLSQALVSLSSYLPGLAEVFSVETLLWKLRMLDSACSYTNSRIHAVKAQTLILSSGRDQLLPSRQEGERLHRLLPNSDIRTFNDSGHMLFMEQDHDLVTILKGASFYRRTRNLDYVFDYLPPSPYEFRKARESHSLIEEVFSPVMLSTLNDGKIVRGLEGIPSEGPVLFVGYHMMLGLELAPLVAHIFSERNILVRGIAHPMMFRKLKEGRLPDISQFDTYRIMGAVPVSATNLFKLLKLKSHVLLYPGGMREALHRKGEEYKLFWPEQSEFVRMAARFGAKIIPFGVVGEDDIGELIFDYEDQMKIPYLRTYIQELTEEAVRLRSESEGEVANQDVHLPIMRPKLPGRFYYLFGKAIETEGRKQELKKREKADELYLQVKSEVESCLCYLKVKRESDPYRSILTRSIYRLTHGPESEIPAFEP